MKTDLETGWSKRKRAKYDVKSDGEEAEVKPMPGVIWLSDILRVVDAKRQTGYNDDDLPAQFKSSKSFGDVPHHFLETDGYPSSLYWLDMACEKYGRNPKGKGSKLTEQTHFQNSSSTRKGDLKECTAASHEEHSQVEIKEIDSGTSIKRLPMSLPSLYDVEQGKESDSVILPLAGKIRRGRKTRHPVKAKKALAARRAELSSACQQLKPGKRFHREYRRFNDPVLPAEDYDRTKEIVSKLYHVLDHGHGQLVDMETKQLICTFAFEDLETMDEDQRRSHQSDVETIMMATELFRQMPINKFSNSKSNTNEPSQITLNSSPLDTSNPKTINPLPAPEDPDKGNGLIGGSSGSPLLALNSDYSSPLTSLPPSESDEFEVTAEELKKELEIILKNHPSQLLSPTRESLALTSLSPSEGDIAREIPPIKQSKAQVTTNGALIHGKMFCFGARPGYDPEILYSPYIPRQGASLSLYKLFLSQLPIFGSNLGARFKTFADEAFLTARQQLNTIKAPSMTSTDKDEPLGPFDFAGNFAFTFHNFFNKPHTDNDKGNVYGIWYPIESISRRIVTTSEGFSLVGGWFLFPEYRIAFNFGGKNVVQISWSGKRTFHQTLPSKEEEAVGSDGKKIHFTRLGCSSQLTSSLARAAAKLGTEEQYNFRSNCERDLLDCKDVLDLGGRKWKK